mmetsp:Transcript_18346/g.51987  ORF Transcript_18346/g.51987 Transcript_18346/m.51987 type:complete len:222 (-) Transcript_18346:382-1047(-)
MKLCCFILSNRPARCPVRPARNGSALVSLMRSSSRTDCARASAPIWQAPPAAQNASIADVRVGWSVPSRWSCIQKDTISSWTSPSQFVSLPVSVSRLASPTAPLTEAAVSDWAASCPCWKFSSTVCSTSRNLLVISARQTGSATRFPRMAFAMSRISLRVVRLLARPCFSKISPIFCMRTCRLGWWRTSSASLVWTKSLHSTTGYRSCLSLTAALSSCRQV